jgi:tRNA modification GTPase
MPPRALRRVRILGKDGAIVDDATAVRLPGSATYTGEPMLEIFCHGGQATTEAVLNALLAAGCRAALPGEFSLRAYLNGKMDLATAEAVCDQIKAGTEAAQRLAVRQREGAVSRAVEALRSSIVGLTAAAEVTIDFSDEVGDLDTEEFGRRLGEVLEHARALVESGRAGRLLREGARIAIVGRPNVGKSSLLNALLGIDRAIVSPHAGTTRDTIEETLQVAGIPLTLVDTAGLRDSDDPVEQIGVERTRGALISADLVLHVFDASEGWSAADAAVAAALPQTGVVTAANKCDLTADRTAGGAVPVSAKTGEGMDALRAAILQVLDVVPNSADHVVLSRARHLDAMRGVVEALESVQRSLEAGLPSDFLTIDLRGALQALGEITGETATEEIVHRIFHDFCVGK